MNEVWNEEITTLGYRAPKADKPTGGHRGGNPNKKIDIFIQDVGRPSIGVYGYCTTDDPRRSVRRDVSAYCVLDDDYSPSQFPGVKGVDALKVTASHEFHHASQFAYDWKEDRALMEATATNMEADVYPTIHDNFQYFVFSPLTNPNTQDDGPWWPIDTWDAQFGNQYGDWIFYRFLEEYIGSPTHPNPTRNPAINRVIWEKAAAIAGTNKGGKYSTQAIRSAIAAFGGTFDAAFAEFGWANASPSNWYDEGELYPTAGFVDRGSFGTGFARTTTTATPAQAGRCSTSRMIRALHADNERELHRIHRRLPHDLARPGRHRPDAEPGRLGVAHRHSAGHRRHGESLRRHLRRRPRGRGRPGAHERQHPHGEVRQAFVRRADHVRLPRECARRLRERRLPFRRPGHW